MEEITVKVHDNAEAARAAKNLKKLGYERTQNAFWIEWWEKGNSRVVIDRDF